MRFFARNPPLPPETQRKALEQAQTGIKSDWASDLRTAMSLKGHVSDPEALTRLQNGEISFVDPGAERTLELALALTTGTQTLGLLVTIAPEVELKNRQLSTPLLEEALSGDQELRAQYESTRLLSYKFLPPSLLVPILKIGITSLSSPERLAEVTLHNAERRKAIMKSYKLHITPEHCAVVHSLNVWLTYQTGIEFVSLAREKLDTQTPPALPLVTKKTPEELAEFSRAFNSSYSATAPGAPGRLFRTTLTSMLNQLLHARILVDLFSARNITLEDDQFRAISNSYSNPWDVLESPLVSKIFQFDSYCSERGNRTPMSNPVVINELFYSRRSFEQIFERAVGVKETPKQSPVLPQPERRMVSSEYVSPLQQIKRGLEVVVGEHFSSNSQRAELVRKLYELYRRTPDCSYQELLDSIRNEAKSGRHDPEAMIAELQEKFARKLEAEAVFQEPKIEHVSGPPAESPSQQIDGYHIVHARSSTGNSLFQRSLDGHSNQAAFRAIHSAIREFTKGNLGDSKPTRRTDIWERRIDLGDGFRIHFAIQGRSVILLNIGTKRNQDSSLDEAESNLATHRSLAS